MRKDRRKCRNIKDLMPKKGRPIVKMKIVEYIPTLEEIAIETEKIRQGWSESERRERAGLLNSPLMCLTFRNGILGEA